MRIGTHGRSLDRRSIPSVHRILTSMRMRGMVPVAAEVIRRCAPLLGLRPSIDPVNLEPAAQDGVTLASNASDN